VAPEVARGLGFEPHADFAKAAGHLGEWDGVCDLEFGREGCPCTRSADPLRLEALAVDDQDFAFVFVYPVGRIVRFALPETPAAS
jgi:hypothetical protein